MSTRKQKTYRRKVSRLWRNRFLGTIDSVMMATDGLIVGISHATSRMNGLLDCLPVIGRESK